MQLEAALPAALLALGACVGANADHAAAGGAATGLVPNGPALSGSASSTGGASDVVGGGPTPVAAGASGEPPRSGASWVYTQGRQLWVGRRQAGGELAAPAPYRLKCVGWSPTGIGERNTAGYTPFYTEYAAQDLPLIAGVSANTVKTYSPFEPSEKGWAILDQLYASGVMVVMNVMPSKWEAENGTYLRVVEYFRAHPAILMWQLGNELNYNKLYSSLTLDQAVNLVVEATQAIHAADPDHPVSVSWGNAPSGMELAKMQAVDVWSLNLYPHLAMQPRLTSWTGASNKPMFVGEYGADAYNTKIDAEDQPSQSTATTDLTQQIQSQANAGDARLPVLGGCVFNLTDEWWKGKGTDTAHDTGGFEISGVYPDGVANEEWWGLLTIERQPRQAYTALKSLYSAL
jgi:hypothetical protein